MPIHTPSTPRIAMTLSPLRRPQTLKPHPGPARPPPHRRRSPGARGLQDPHHPTRFRRSCGLAPSLRLHGPIHQGPRPPRRRYRHRASAANPEGCQRVAGGGAARHPRSGVPLGFAPRQGCQSFRRVSHGQSASRGGQSRRRSVDHAMPLGQVASRGRRPEPATESGRLVRARLRLAGGLFTASPHVPPKVR